MKTEAEKAAENTEGNSDLGKTSFVEIKHFK